MSDLDDEELRATRKLNGVEWEEDIISRNVGELEEISANEIIRTTEGKLYSIVSATEDDFLCNELNGKSNQLKLLSDLEIKNHKIDIIGLIEVGDYVNGMLVQKIAEPSLANDYKKLIYCNECEGLYEGIFDNNEIKTIVTHEQFNSVMYKVKE